MSQDNAILRSMPRLSWKVESLLICIAYSCTANLYSLCLHSEDKGFILFVNPVAEDDEQKNLIEEVINLSGKKGKSSNTFLLDDCSKSDIIDKEGKVVREEKDDSEVCFQNALAMLHKLKALYVTIKGQELINGAFLRKAIVTHLRKNKLTTNQLGKWAKGLLQFIAMIREHENANLRRYRPKVFEWLGTSLA